MSKNLTFSHISKLIFGASAAQVVTFIATPVATRLYSPDEYGAYSLFSSTVGIIVCVSTLGYGSAIVAARKGSVADSLFVISTWILAAISGILLLGYLILPSKTFGWLVSEDKWNLMALVPLAVLTLSLEGLLQQKVYRQAMFGYASGISMLSAIFQNGLRVVFGFLSPSSVTLSLAAIIGPLASAAMSLFIIRRETGGVVASSSLFHSSSRWLGAVARAYADYPLYRLPQVLLNNIGYSLPVFALNEIAGPRAVGYYGIAVALVGVPAAIMGGAVISVLTTRVSQILSARGSPTALLINSTAILCVIGLGVFMPLALGADRLFPLVFGRDWAPSADYAIWLCVLGFFTLVSRPAVAAAGGARMNKALLNYEVLAFSLRLVALLGGAYVNLSGHGLIACYVLASAVSYTWLTSYVLQRMSKIA